MSKLNGKVALVTGASRGIGAAIAKRLAVVEVGDPRLGQNRNLGLGKALAERTQRGQGHDGVAQPVGGADQDAIVRHSS